MSLFTDKVCIVTGGAGGIGKSLCEQLAQAGGIVVASDVNRERLDKTVQNICKKGGRCTSEIFDVSNHEAFKKCINDTVEREGRLDYIFNNAGIAFGAQIQDTEIEDWKKVLDVNLNGVIYGALEAYKVMVKQGFGHIINLSSVEGFIPFPFTSSYVVSKFAVLGLSQSMWLEGRDLGVKVSAVCPGFIKTDIFDVTPVRGLDMQKWLEANAKWEKFGVTPEMCAKVILKGVEKDKAIIPVTFLAKFFWFLARLGPTFVLKTILKDFRKWRESVKIPV